MGLYISKFFIDHDVDTINNDSKFIYYQKEFSLLEPSQELYIDDYLTFKIDFCNLYYKIITYEFDWSDSKDVEKMYKLLEDKLLEDKLLENKLLEDKLLEDKLLENK